MDRHIWIKQLCGFPLRLAWSITTDIEGLEELIRESYALCFQTVLASLASSSCDIGRSSKLHYDYLTREDLQPLVVKLLRPCLDANFF